MKIKSLLAAVTLLISAQHLQAQKWVEDMQKPDANLYQIQQEFEAYWSTRDHTEKGKGYKAFKRWENFVAPRVYPSGNLSVLSEAGVNWQNFVKQQNNTASSGNGKNIGSSPALVASATWTAMGPHGPLAGMAGSQFLKSGRLNFITIDPTNTLSLWVGAPAGGLWHSTNGGTSWTTNTDQLAVTGCSDLVIDPTNSSVMYLATGDGDAGDTRSIGVLKSTDGGLTWNATGLTNPVTTNFLIRRLLINPSNPQILLAATNLGIYRTTNGGTNWSVVSTSGCYDLEFKPGDPNTVYAGGNTFRLSTNGGASFVNINTGLPSTGFQRIAIAVTPANQNYVYLLGSSGTNSGFQGLYRSVGSGTSFAVMSTSANINVLGWNSNGQDVGGQGWYDLCIAASPLNADEIVTGGVNIWRSLDGGTSWGIYSHWTGSGAPFAHADQHDLEYAADGTLFSCNDGTVYRRTATGWLEISGTMNISQIYKIGLSSLTANRWITGHQDNGTSIFTGTSYNAELGGDGMDCFIDRTNDQICFGEYQNGGFNRTLNGGATWQGCTSGMSGTAPWITIWKQDPVSATTFYAARSNLFRSTNLSGTGTPSWGTLTALPVAGQINEFAIAPSNNQVIYVLKNTGIFKTINGGTSWTTVTGNVPVSSASPQFITIDPLDANNAWVVLSGYSAGNKVFMTTDGGATWTNYSANLPNLPGNCSVYQPGTNDMIYVGMDVGIYYRNSTATQWTLYNQGLPNVPVSDMEISPASPNFIHAATYGRGVWMASVVSNTGAPVSQFIAATQNKCAGLPVTFTDQSANTPTGWSWTVTPSAGVSISSATVQNPNITFAGAGTYTVMLTASNASGMGNTYTQVVTIGTAPVLSISPMSHTTCAGKPVTFTASGATSYTWSGISGSSGTVTYLPNSSAVYTVTGKTSSCSSMQTVSVTALPLPSVLITGSAGPVCPEVSVPITATGAMSYTWNTGAVSNNIVASSSVTTTYSVTGEDANGCVNKAYYYLAVHPVVPVAIAASNTMVCADEEVTLSALGAPDFTWTPGSQTGLNIVVFPQTTTSYTSSSVDNNGCSIDAQITVSVAVCEGISENLSKLTAVKVYPNPSSDKVYISMNTPQSIQVNVQVTDVSGRVIFTKAMLTGGGLAGEIDAETFSAGTYFIRISAPGGPDQSVRFIKSNN